MKLYKVTFDDQPDFIEAENLRDAITIWRGNLLKTNDNDPDFIDIDPESAELVHDEPVLR